MTTARKLHLVYAAVFVGCPAGIVIIKLATMLLDSLR